jgi:hypothetical protein
MRPESIGRFARYCVRRTDGSSYPQSGNGEIKAQVGLRASSVWLVDPTHAAVPTFDAADPRPGFWLQKWHEPAGANTPDPYR